MITEKITNIMVVLSFSTAVILLFGLVIPSSVRGIQQQQQSSSEYLTYDNPQFGINVQYPAEWQKKVYGNSAMTGAIASMPTGQNISTGPMSSPQIGQVSNNSQRSENIVEFSTDSGARLVIRVDDLGSNMSLSDFTQNNLDNLKKGVPGFILIASKATILDGNPAQGITYSGLDENDEEKHFLSLWTVSGNKAYVATFSAKPGTYGHYIRHMFKVFDSFNAADLPHADVSNIREPDINYLVIRCG